MKGFTTKELKIKQKLFFKYKEFKPLLTIKQYKIYVEHIDWLIQQMRER